MFESPLDSLNGKLSKNNKLSLFINILRWCHTLISQNFLYYFQIQTLISTFVKKQLHFKMWKIFYPNVYGSGAACMGAGELVGQGWSSQGQPLKQHACTQHHPLVQRSNKASILSYQSALIKIYHLFS